MLPPDLDGVRGTGELPSVGTFADALHDDVGEKAVLKLIADKPELLHLLPVAPRATAVQGIGEAVEPLTERPSDRIRKPLRR
ncbi:hypothetical protein JHN63_43250 [Streptomyces sp. MBT65]|uniref:hypothetical protein n=1 Tax=Streptomyces sp. MBT65 TaxID=1488395 RepID=UPI00190BF223|nr:hypothetical protein [Streptomyces sp. MBT65]MBK3580489.1 hypothetical protein [Streptomyces sp. MBT65]